MVQFDPTKYGARKLNNIPASSGSNAGVSPIEQPIQNKPQADTYGAFLPATGKENALQAGAKSLVNVPSSAFNLAKGIAGAIAHPVQTVKGIVGTGAGVVEKLIPGVQPQEKYADAVGGYLKERYGSLENAQRTAINDPFGFGTDVMSLISGGAGAVGKTGELSKAISTVAKPITTPIAKGVRLATTATKEIATGVAGATTGVGKEAFTQALKNEAGFTEGLRNKINITDVLNEAQGGLSEVKKLRSAEYTQAMDNIKTLNPQSLDISPVINTAKEITKKFNIKMGENGVLDLSRSPLVGDSAKVNAVFDLLDSWGTQAGDRTIAGVDILKRQLRDFREPTNPTLNKFVDDLTRSVRDIAEKVPGYSDVMKKYGNYSDFVDELERTLSLKESATPDQAITKLNSLLRDNADYRRMLVDELKNATGKDILAPIAGKALSKVAPQGLSKYVAVGAGATMPTLIPYIAFASPRVMGEFFRIAGITSKTIGNILSDINNFRVGAGLNPIKTKIEEVNKTMAGKGGLSIQDVTKNRRIEPRKYKTAEEFVYHTTPAENILSIQKEGLKSGGGQFGKGTYLTADEETLKNFIRDFDVQLRIKKGVANRFGELRENQTAYRSSKELQLPDTGLPLPAEVIEIKTKKGDWIPLKDAEIDDFKDIINVYKARDLSQWWDKNYDNLPQADNDFISRVFYSNGETGGTSNVSNVKLQLKPAEKTRLDKITKSQLIEIWKKEHKK